MRLGIIGCGGQAQNVFAPCLLTLRDKYDLSFVACCDVSETRAAQMAQKTGFEKTYTDYKEMLAKEALDCLIIVTHFTATCEIACHAMRLGIPSLIEKPPGQNAAEAAKIAQTAAEFGTINQLAFNRRHLPLFCALKEELKGQTVRHIGYEMHRINRREDFFRVTAVHAVDAAAFLAGSDFEKAWLLYQMLPQYGAGIWNLQMQAQFASGATAQLSFDTWSGRVTELVSVITDEKSYYVRVPIWDDSGDVGTLSCWEGGKLLWERLGSEFETGARMVDTNGFTWQLDNFLSCVQSGTQPRDSLASGLNSLSIMDAMEQYKTYWEK